jgi:hypothetical protein
MFNPVQSILAVPMERFAARMDILATRMEHDATPIDASAGHFFAAHRKSNGYTPQLDVVMKEGGHATSKRWPPRRRRGTGGSSC